LELALQSIAADPAVQALVIFGSRATGTARPESDLDLPVDLIVSGSADAARLAGSRWHVISEAARHGRVLVVRP
jgi:predicted nucleotidyltransferase